MAFSHVDCMMPSSILSWTAVKKAKKTFVQSRRPTKYDRSRYVFYVRMCLYALMPPVFRLNVTSTAARSYKHLLALGSNGPTTDTDTVLLPATIERALDNMTRKTNGTYLERNMRSLRNFPGNPVDILDNSRAFSSANRNDNGRRSSDGRFIFLIFPQRTFFKYDTIISFNYRTLTKQCTDRSGCSGYAVSG